MFLTIKSSIRLVVLDESYIDGVLLYVILSIKYLNSLKYNLVTKFLVSRNALRAQNPLNKRIGTRTFQVMIPPFVLVFS